MKTFIGSLALLFASFSFTAGAQDMSNGADNFYKSSMLATERVSFNNQYRMTIVGNLFIPSNLDRSARHPAIIVGHPMGAVKEQSSNLYAQKLAEQGFVTLAIDQSFWGESEGQPRNAVAPDIYAEAFSAAVDYLGTQSFVDRERIGVLGICGSGSFVISAAKIDPRMKAIATVSMYDMGAANRECLEPLADTRAAQADHRRRPRSSATWSSPAGKPKYTGGTVQKLEANTDPIQREFYDFYRTAARRVHSRGLVAAANDVSDANQQCEVHELLPVQRHRDDLAASDAVHRGRPGTLPRVREEAYKLAGQPKELYWVEDAGHVDLYDRTDLIPFDKLTTFFRVNLKESGHSALGALAAPSFEYGSSVLFTASPGIRKRSLTVASTA